MPESNYHPILFSAPMVLALLEGRKTQTRRVITRRNSLSSIGWDRLDFTKPAYIDDSYNPPCAMVKIAGPEGTSHRVFSRYEVGDRLWVRETWGLPHNNQASEMLDHRDLVYRADGDVEFREYGLRWRPSIHMPRWASRITLEVTDVRVQRVQEISDEDVVAEGVDIGKQPYPIDAPYLRDFDIDFEVAFRELWDSINAKRGYGWDTNPLVWALTFKLLELANAKDEKE